MQETWQMKNLTVKNKATSKRNLLFCSNTFQQPPLQTLNPYNTTLGSVRQEAIGNSAENLGVTSVIPKSSWCYISVTSKKKKKFLKKSCGNFRFFSRSSPFLHKSIKTPYGSSQFSFNTWKPYSPSGFCSNPLPSIKNLNEFHQNSLLRFWISQI